MSGEPSRFYKPGREGWSEGGNPHYSFPAILGMESEGGDEKRQRVLALSSALQVEFEVG